MADSISLWMGVKLYLLNSVKYSLVPCSIHVIHNYTHTVCKERIEGLHAVKIKSQRNEAQLMSFPKSTSEISYTYTKVMVTDG